VIELLVALVLGGIVIGLVLQLVSGQARMMEMQGSREEVQQNSRAALELIASDLRGVPGGDAIVRADRDSLTMRAPRIWGVICDLPAGGAVDLAVPAITGATYPVNLGTGLVINLGSVAVPNWTAAVPLTSIGAAGPTCRGEDLPGGVERRRVMPSTPPRAASAVPEIGHVAYLYEQVTYRSGSSGGVPGRWAQRRIGDGAGATNQPMAGPVGEASGLTFEYFTNQSMTPVPTPVIDPAGRAGITSVRVAVEAVSRNRMGRHRESGVDTLTVVLRNRP